MHHDKPTQGIINLFQYVEHDFETDPTSWVQVTKWMSLKGSNIGYLEHEFNRLDSNDLRPFLLHQRKGKTVALFRHRLPDDNEDILCGYDDAFLNLLKKCRKGETTLQQLSAKRLNQI